MSSIDEKLKSLREIQQSLSDLQNNLKQDQSIIESELSQMKERWNDSQMDKFRSKTYVGNFTEILSKLISRIDKANDFLENKYSTLETHRS